MRKWHNMSTALTNKGKSLMLLLVGGKNCEFRNSKDQIKVDPVRLVITGDARVGKWCLMKTISKFLSKTFSYYSCAPGQLNILLLTLTGIAAINIDGTTIYAGLLINPSSGLVLGKNQIALNQSYNESTQSWGLL